MSHEQQSRRNPPPSFADAEGFLERDAPPDRPKQGDHHSESRRREQLRRLAEFAKSCGCLIPPGLYTTPDDQGAEHRVFGDAARSRAVKVTNTNRCGMSFFEGEPVAALPTEYLRRWRLHNQIFGDDVEFDGVMESPGGISIVVSQKWIIGEPPTLEQIIEFMASLGFEKTDSLHDYYRASDNLAVIDCHEANLLLGFDGQMYAIDVIPVVADQATLQHLGVL